MSIKLSDLPSQYQDQVLKKISSEPSKLEQLMAQNSPAPAPATRKYHNAPTKRQSGALKFQSRKEAKRYDELVLMLRGGAIRNLKLQPQFTLQESYLTPDGQRVRAIQYIADFSYEIKVASVGSSGEYRWQLVVEDVKSSGTRTEQYKIKRKLMLERLGIEIKEI